MSDKVTYYAIVDSHSARQRPAGVLRRVEHEGGHRDEAFGRDLNWGPTTLLYSCERGNLDNELYEVTEREANAIITRARHQTTPA